MKSFIRESRASKSTLRKVEGIIAKWRARERLLKSKGVNRKHDHAFEWRES